MAGNLQLFAINKVGETCILQLSSYDPIRMTLSVAEQNPFVPSSYYSQTFRIPGQGENVNFFEDVYSVNGFSFDATKAAEAWILSDGFLFTVGNLTLKSVIRNEKYGIIEYEVLFMGDTSTFASDVGDGYMNEIDTSALNHALTYANVTSSWGATAGGTAGFKNGDVLYPLIEWGYNYNSASVPTQVTLSNGFPKGSTGPAPAGSFTAGTTGGLDLKQWKPATRVKWLWDQIFAEAGYTYTSAFIESDLFDRMYFISDNIARSEQFLNVGVCQIAGRTFRVPLGDTQRIFFTNIIADRDRTFDTILSEWTAPLTGTYTIRMSLKAKVDPSGGPTAVFRIDSVNNGIPSFGSNNSFSSSPAFTFVYTSTITGSYVQGDVLSYQLTNFSFSNANLLLYDVLFEVLDGPDDVIVSNFYPGEGSMKKIDFIKGVTKMFNLVFEPDRDSAKSFKVEPWIDWIQGGEQKDWTEYLDGSTDLQQIPVFQDQQRNLIFTGTDDSDIQNFTFQEEYKRSFMFRQYDSGINIIKGVQETKVPFAGTPLQSLPSKTVAQYPNWVFPTVAKLQTGDQNQPGSGRLQPVQIKPRILFYNGLQANDIPWYLFPTVAGTTGAIAQNSYPLVSTFETWPPSKFTQELTFQSKPQLWSPEADYVQTTANDLYTVYWQDFVEWLYDPFNRKVLATFKLDPKVVQSLKFNDKIWVKDSWYMITKITDYPVGDIAKVKVEMIKCPTPALPRVTVGATGPTTGASCASVSLCYTQSLTAENTSYNYVDCSGNLQSITLAPDTCNAVCMLYPPVNPLPEYWSAIVTGGCTGGEYFELGEDVEMSIGATGAIIGNNVQGVIYGATGGTSGTYIPMQYYFITPQNEINVNFNVPFNYGVKMELLFPTGVSGASIDSQTMILKTNGVTGFAYAATGSYQPVTGIFPLAITGGSTYTAELEIDF
jgi:hypothetical protein